MIAPAESLSTDVDGWVLIEGVRHPLWQIGPDRLMLRRSINAAPQAAEVLLTIDDSETHMRVFLPDGSSISSPLIRFHMLEDALAPQVHPAFTGEPPANAELDIP